MADYVSAKVYRNDPGARAARFDTFRVEVYQHMSVLDLLFCIIEEHDPGVGFRFSCRVGMCGSCGVLVNGREVLACQTSIASVGPEVELRPLSHLPVTRDLLVDLGPFFDRFSRVEGRFAGSPGNVADFVPDDHSVLNEPGNCIGCGLCLSACSMLDFDSDFVGPAALYRALTLEEDAREEGGPNRLALVDDEHGVWRCHVHQDCLDVCPKDLPLTQAIQTLKRRAVVSALRGKRREDPHTLPGVGGPRR